MLSYQHIYHAGNAADVQKHLWLMAVLKQLKGEAGPVTWVDTHAGRGLYDLNAPEAQKLGEYRSGILSLLSAQKGRQPGLIAEYIALVRRFNKGPDQDVRFYPGSAAIAAGLLGRQDRLHVCDLHPGEFRHLQKNMARYDCARAAHCDGMQKLRDVARAKPGRGGALIDPSYEIKSEYETIAADALAVLAQWPQAVLMIWYPMLKAGLHEGLKAACVRANPVVDEWVWGVPGETKGLYGSGMILFNAPGDVADQVARCKAFVEG